MIILKQRMHGESLCLSLNDALEVQPNIQYSRLAFGENIITSSPGLRSGEAKRSKDK